MQYFALKFFNKLSSTQVRAIIDTEVNEAHHAIMCIGNSVNVASIPDNFDNFYDLRKWRFLSNVLY